MITSFAALSFALAASALDVRVDPRVELLTIVFRLAGGGEFNQPSAESPYSTRVDTYFANYKNHAVVKMAERIRDEYGVSFNAVPTLAVHLKDTRTLGELVPFEPAPGRWDERWKPHVTRQFVRELQHFVRDVRFARFLDLERDYYRAAEASFRSLVAKHPADQWLRDFYGFTPKHKPFAIIGLLCGGGNYGVSVEFGDKSVLMTPVFGASSFNDRGVPTFQESNLATVIHEFSHGYLNTLVQAHMSRLSSTIEPYEAVLEQVWAAGAYAGAKTIAYESFVRAVEYHLMQKHMSPSLARDVLVGQREEGFLWTSDLAAALKTYESNRHEYKTIVEFMPKWIRAFNEAARDPELLYARCPHVTGLKSVLNDLDTEHKSAQVTITFDQPMLTDRRGFSMEPEGWEVLEKTRYSEDGRSLSLRVKVDKSKSYRIHLNWFGRGYVSQAGYPLLPVSRPLSRDVGLVNEK